MDCARVVKNIQNNAEAYFKKYGIKSIVIGISGGIDSTLCAALLYPVCQKLGMQLIGRSLPCLTNKKDELDRADLVGSNFCTDYKVVDIQPMYESLVTEIAEYEVCAESERAEAIRRGNVKARTRMVYLYNLAYVHKGLVISTDNLTELNLGFWTLHGDVGDYSPIQNLWKTEVYEISKYLVHYYTELGDFESAQAIQMGVDAIPTDGLGITSSDLEQLGAPTYNEVDRLLKKAVDKEEEWEKGDMEHPVIVRHFASAYKRNNPYCIPREEFFA